MKKTLTLAAAALVAIGGAFALLPGTPEGCGAKCCMRPLGVAVESCLRRPPNSSAPVDFGAENVIHGNEAVGAGCVPTECVLGVGVEFIDGGAP